MYLPFPDAAYPTLRCFALISSGAEGVRGGERMRELELE